MATLVKGPTIIRAEGTGDKLINEFFGLVNSGTDEVSIAHMISPAGWSEPGQRPEFNEYTIVLKGRLLVETITDRYTVLEGQAILAPKYEWVRYSTPAEEGAEYIAICVPAFSPATVNRDKVKES
jgi:mannose-6-phosphate isomerase-like protein (cupin superfamily)